MKVSITGNIDQVLTDAARMHPQFRFAVAKAMTDTMRMVQAGLPAETVHSLDRPVEFTKRGFYMQPARKDNLQASVGVKDAQAQYLQYQVEGGRRAPRNVALRLPSVAQLNQYGNIPAGLIRTLIARARAGKRATKAQARRFGVSQQIDLFYGDPGDGRPAGIYKRVALSATKHQLVPVIVFPKQAASYTERRLDFYGFSDRTFQREFGPALDRSWRQAFATAR